jgi:hypothetical protein
MSGWRIEPGAAQCYQVEPREIHADFPLTAGGPSLVVLRHKLQRERPFGFAPQHGQRERIATSLAMSLRRMVAMEFGTWRSGRSGGASGSVTLGKGKLREESFGN